MNQSQSRKAVVAARKGIPWMNNSYFIFLILSLRKRPWNLYRMDVDTTWFLRCCIWSTLESLQDGCRYHLVLEVLYLINIANWRGLIVNLFWNPSHLGIGGNEACDQAATPVLKHGCVPQIPLGQSEIVSLAKEQIEKKNTAIPVGHQHSGKLL